MGKTFMRLYSANENYVLILLSSTRTINHHIKMKEQEKCQQITFAIAMRDVSTLKTTDGHAGSQDGSLQIGTTACCSI